MAQSHYWIYVRKPPDFIEITAAVQIPHSFYNGVESVVMVFPKGMNEKVPNDSRPVCRTNPLGRSVAMG
jgi:hypothetical protein